MIFFEKTNKQECTSDEVKHCTEIITALNAVRSYVVLHLLRRHGESSLLLFILIQYKHCGAVRPDIAPTCDCVVVVVIQSIPSIPYLMLYDVLHSDPGAG